MVEISEDYLTFLHDQLAINQAKLKQVLNEEGAKVIFDASADDLAALVTKGDVGRTEDALVKRIEGWGMQVTKSKSGRIVEFEMDCPYAKVVHPKMSAEKPVCPMGEYVLGVVRQADPGAQLKHNHLKTDGAKFTIESSA